MGFSTTIALQNEEALPGADQDLESWHRGTSRDGLYNIELILRIDRSAEGDLVAVDEQGHMLTQAATLVQNPTAQTAVSLLESSQDFAGGGTLDTQGTFAFDTGRQGWRK